LFNLVGNDFLAFGPSLAFDGPRPEKFKMDMLTERLRNPPQYGRGIFRSQFAFQPIHFAGLVKYDLCQRACHKQCLKTIHWAGKMDTPRLGRSCWPVKGPKAAVFTSGMAAAFAGCVAVAIGNQVNKNVIIINPPVTMFYRAQ
jgi:hypothetical protein